MGFGSMNLNQTSHKLRNFLAGWIGITLLAMAAGAVSPQTWRISTFNDFSDGESERVSIQHPGEIRLAPSIQPFAEVKESAIWSLAASPDGGTLYAGTGNSAKIYRIAGTPGTATAEARLFADLDGNTVHALLIGSDGALYAGVSPGGSVYKISDEGAVTLIGASGQDYIWAMVQDATGDLILATGDKGQILRMALDGKTKTLVKTGEKHILSLVKNADGKIYFGTASNGWVAELVNEKDFRVLYDSDLGEVKSLALAPDGTLYAGIIPTVQVDAKRDVPQPTPAPPSPKTDKSSEIVKITPDGLARLLDKTPGAAANAMLVADQGLLVGSGDEGKLFRVGYRDELDLVSDLQVSEILGLLPRQNDGVWMITGNPAKVFILSPATDKGGTYASKVLDAETASLWGELNWVASVPEGASLAFETRSGNSKDPGENWSKWSAAMPKPGKVTSPAARYLQWRVKMGGTASGDSAVIQEAEIVYQSLNRPPRIETLQVGDSAGSSESSSSNSTSKSNGTASKSSSTASKSSSSESSSSSAQKDSIPLSWKAEDPNGDTLVYRLEYRRVQETLWKEIEKDLKAAKHSWDVSNLPDGKYEVRLTASDRLTNPPGQVGEDSYQSEPILLDKTAPEVAEWTGQKVEGNTFDVRVLVRDKTSRLTAVEVILDGRVDERLSLLPEDGILDSTEETFQVHIGDLAAGEHSISLLAEDEEGNAGAGYLLFTVP